MIVYLDASALVKHYVAETGSEAIRQVLREGITTTSRLTEVEIASALARRCREGDLSETDRDRLLTDLASDMTRMFVVEPTPLVTAEAVDLLRRHPLRAMDAIQLASCLVLARRLAFPIHFVAFDQRLNASAAAEGVTVEDAGRSAP